MDKSEKKHVEYYVVKRYLSIEVDRLRIEKTTFELKIEYLEYGLDGALAKEKKAITDLSKFDSSAENICHHAELLR